MNHNILRLLLPLLLVGCAHTASLEADSDTQGSDKQQVLRIFADIDRQTEGLEEHWAAISEDIVYMQHGNATLEGKEAYKEQALDFFTGGSLELRHEIIDLQSYFDVVIVRGRASGRFQPPGDTTVYPWSTRNVFILKRSDSGKLLVTQIMVNTES